MNIPFVFSLIAVGSISFVAGCKYTDNKWHSEIKSIIGYNRYNALVYGPHEDKNDSNTYKIIKLDKNKDLQ
jgi:hypothetical protein